MNQNSTSKDLFLISILTVVTVAVWIAVDVYLVLKKDEPEKISQELLAPLNPKLDISILDELDKKNYYNLKEIPKSPQITISEEIPEATEEAETQ